MINMAKSRASVSAALFDSSSWFTVVSSSLVDWSSSFAVSSSSFRLCSSSFAESASSVVFWFSSSDDWCSSMIDRSRCRASARSCFKIAISRSLGSEAGVRLDAGYARRGFE